MITRGQVNRLRTLADAEALLLQWRSEDQVDFNRAKAIIDEIKVLRTELSQLRKNINAGVTEEDILQKIGQLYSDSL